MTDPARVENPELLAVLRSIDRRLMLLTAAQERDDCASCWSTEFFGHRLA